MNTFFDRSGKSITVAGAVVTVCDLATPILPFSAYFFGVSLLAVAGLIITKYVINRWNESCSIAMYFSTGILVLSGMIFFWQEQNVDSQKVGVIASNIDVFSSLQNKLGMITDSVAAIEKNTTEMNKKMDILKKETSSDPKKELANQGISWTRKSFLEAITNGDDVTLLLFIKGGFSTNLYSREDHNLFLKFISDIPEEKFENIMSILYRYNLLKINYGLDIFTVGLPYKPVEGRSYKYINSIIADGISKNSDYTRPSLSVKVNLLTLAIWEGNEKYVSFLLKQGENPNYQGLLDATNESSPVITPIGDAELFGNEKIKKILRKYK